MSFGAKSDGIKPTIQKQEPAKLPASKLDENVKDFVKLIFNKKMMEESVVSIGYDVKRLPLGELSQETVLEGYKILRDIELVLAKKSTTNLEILSSKFYTFIPHNFGMARMS